MSKKNNDKNLKNFSHSIGQNWYHIVLVPKCRYPVFQYLNMKMLAEEAMDMVCKNHRIEIFEKEVMEDHVHIFVDCPPQFSIRKLIQILKGGSSYYIRKKAPSLKRYKFLWSEGYMYRGVSNVTAKTVKKYIQKSNVWTGWVTK